MSRTRIAAAMILLPLCLGAIWIGAAEPTSEVQPTPAAALRGVWKGASSPTQVFRMEFRGDVMELKIAVGDSIVAVRTARVEFPQGHADRHMDWVDVRVGERKYPDNKCLYKIEGDTLMLVGGGPNERPTEFFSGPGGEPKSLILTREAPVKK